MENKRCVTCAYCETQMSPPVCYESPPVITASAASNNSRPVVHKADIACSRYIENPSIEEEAKHIEDGKWEVQKKEKDRALLTISRLQSKFIAEHPQGQSEGSLSYSSRFSDWIELLVNTIGKDAMNIMADDIAKKEGNNVNSE